MEPIVVTVVESSQDHPWIVFHEYDERGVRDEESYPEDKLIFTSEANVARVVVRYAEKGPAKRAMGFRIETAEEDEP